MAQERMKRNSQDRTDSEIDEVPQESTKTDGIDEDVDNIVKRADEHWSYLVGGQ